MNYYFYDLETSGINPRSDRIMQFGGQRTDLNFKPIGKPDNFLIKITDDVLPHPDAVMVHGISPQQTLKNGLSEAEATRYLLDKVFLPNTITVGFNNIRFDDEFIRFLFWRNFTDAYEWQYKENRSKWDLLDFVRMARALRPKGLNWPVGSEGRPTNRLESLAAINNLQHDDAHDALSDVSASISLARLIRNKQPKFFNYSLSIRDKRKVAAIVEDGKPFLYTSGRYPYEYEKTTIVSMVTKIPDREIALVYDLRIDPEEFIKLSTSELVGLWSMRGEDVPYFPVKKLVFNRCPAVAPLSVLDVESEKRLSINQSDIARNFKKLDKNHSFSQKLLQVYTLVEPKSQPGILNNELVVDSQLYDGFVNSPEDQAKMSVIRAAKEEDFSKLNIEFSDARLSALWPLYRARNFPKLLNNMQKQDWIAFKIRKLTNKSDNQIDKYFTRLDEIGKTRSLTTVQKDMLKELEAYGRAVLPSVVKT